MNASNCKSFYLGIILFTNHLLSRDEYSKFFQAQQNHALIKEVFVEFYKLHTCTMYTAHMFTFVYSLQLGIATQQYIKASHGSGCDIVKYFVLLVARYFHSAKRI